MNAPERPSTNPSTSPSTSPPTSPSTSAYLHRITAETDRIADLVTTGPADAPIAACPGWTLGDLVAHLGGVHRMALHAVRAGERLTTPSAPQGADPATWLRDGAAALVDALAATPADAPAWSPFGDQVAAVWPRRQAHETMVHRWDAEAAVGAVTPLPADMASDAIDEFFEVMVPRFVARGALEHLPSGSVHVHCTDVAGEWLVHAEGDRLHLRREHAKGDAALRGPAAALLLVLWGRTSPADATDVDIVGDAAVAAAWSSLAR